MKNLNGCLSYLYMKWTSCPKWQLKENKMSLKASHVPYGATWKWLFLPHFDITKIVTF